MSHCNMDLKLLLTLLSYIEENHEYAARGEIEDTRRQQHRPARMPPQSSMQYWGEPPSTNAT